METKHLRLFASTVKINITWHFLAPCAMFVKLYILLYQSNFFCILFDGLIGYSFPGGCRNTCCIQRRICPHLRDRNFILNVIPHTNLSFLEKISLGNSEDMLTFFMFLFSKKFLLHRNNATTFVTER